MKINELIKQQLQASIKKHYQIDKSNIVLERPKDSENGNISTNIALQLTKELKQNPMDIALMIVEGLKIEGVFKIEVKKPGFINFFFDNTYFDNIVNEINNQDKFIFNTNENAYYNVEFVSANPTGDLHLGHARNAVYGDSVCRLLTKIGNKVDGEYYINDAGMQMQNLALSVIYFYKQHYGINSQFPQDGYRGNDIQNIALMIVDEYQDTKLEAPLAWFLEYAYAYNLAEIKRVLKELRVSFDIWTSERSLYQDNKVDTNIAILESKGDVYTKDDALWLATSKYGDDKDRVLKKSDGQYTYFASDITYHIDKFNRGYNKLIDVWGGDHHGYINRVKAAIKSLGYDDHAFEVLIIQMINILQNNQRVKMSKRKGTSVTIKELLQEIDVDSLRYFFLMRSPDTQLDFDIALAKTNNSDNPIYYIQYAHARINTLLLKAQAQAINVNNISNYQYSDIEKDIISLLATYPQIIINAANKRLPHLVCNYLYELASLYHRYYNQEMVFNNKKAEINGKINIACAIKTIIKDGLAVLGINAKDKM